MRITCNRGLKGEETRGLATVLTQPAQIARRTARNIVFNKVCLIHTHLELYYSMEYTKRDHRAHSRKGSPSRRGGVAMLLKMHKS
jgi:hypothetical protein